jgi:hypothetical protein
VVDRHRRDAAPVVYAGIEQPGEVVVRQIRRSLHVGSSAEHDPRDRDRPEQLLERRLGSVRHPGPRLRAEVLDDYFLHVAELGGELPNRSQGIDAIGSRLTDADENPGRERHARRARRRDRLEPNGGLLVG